jgi:heme-degrading monooxygenase HmoA
VLGAEQYWSDWLKESEGNLLSLAQFDETREQEDKIGTPGSSFYRKMVACNVRITAHWKEAAMFVRIALFAPEQAAEATEKAWVEDLLFPTARAVPGFAGAYLGIDPESGQGISISFWETEAALLAGDQAVQRLAHRRSTGTLPQRMQVVKYQVVHQATGHSS